MSHTKPLVLHIGPTPFFSDRGCHIRIEGIARSLENLGYNNLICTYHHGRDVEGLTIARIRQIKNYTQTQAGPSKYKPWADLKLLLLVIENIRQHNPSVLHAHLHEGVAIALAAKTLLFWRTIPMVADIQGSLSGELKAHGFFTKYPWLLWPFKLIERALIALSNTVICSSEQSRLMLENEFKLKKEKLSLVQDGANPATPLAESQLTALRDEFRLPDDKFIVVYSGALLGSKGLDNLKTLMQHCAAHPRLHFLIIGYPLENIEPFVTEHKLQKHCTLTGQIPFERLPSLLSLANAAVDPKANQAGEGSGKMLNYLACGLPVLAFDTANNREFLANATQLSNDTLSMANKLKQWSEEPELACAIGAENLNYFKANFSWETTVHQLTPVYQKFRLNQ